MLNDDPSPPDEEDPAEQARRAAEALARDVETRASSPEFDRFVSSVWPLLRTRAVSEAARIVGQSDAEDVVENAVLKLIRTTARYDPAHPGPGGVSAWILEVVKNTARDFRRARRHEQLGIDESVDERAMPSPDGRRDDPSSIAEQREFLHAVADLLADPANAIPEPARYALWLRVIGDDASQAAIAERFGVSRETVNRQFKRTITKLRESALVAELIFPRPTDRSDDAPERTISENDL